MNVRAATIGEDTAAAAALAAGRNIPPSFVFTRRVIFRCRLRRLVFFTLRRLLMLPSVLCVITNISLDYLLQWSLKPDSSADHTADTRTARPAAADLAFSPDISVGTADGHATSAAIALVVGIE